MMNRQSSAGTLAALMLTCVFGATMLLSLVTGAGVYRRVEGRVEQNAQSRVSLNYVIAKIHACDRAGMVKTGSFGDGGAVFLYEEAEGSLYKTILYVRGGQLMEMFCLDGGELAPEFGEPVCAALDLSAAQPKDGLLRLTLTGPDGETQNADIYVRSVG